MSHIHELYDFTSTAYIVNKQRILLVDHKKLGVWIAPGGHIELDEDPLQALWREITEETGLKRQDLRLIDLQQSKPKVSPNKHFQPLPMPFACFVVDYDKTSPHRHIDLCYLLKSNTDQVSHQLEESKGIGWFTKPEIASLHKQGRMFTDSYNYALFALDNLKDK